MREFGGGADVYPHHEKSEAGVAANEYDDRVSTREVEAAEDHDGAAVACTDH